MALEFSDDPWASHLPFLSELGCIRHGIASILELGPGLHSTPLFLNREFYPHVTRILSVEHNPDWADIVRSKCPDERLEIAVHPEPIEPYLETLDLELFDMIFVDNSDTCVRRVETIEYLGGRIATPLVVIHDFQAEFYQDAAHAFPNRIVDKRRPIYTGLVWKGEPISYLGERCLTKTLM